MTMNAIELMLDLRPVDQLYTDVNLDDPNSVLGDCWRAAVATVIGRPALEVPHFVEEARFHELDTQWYFDTAAWLQCEGWSLETWSGPPPGYSGLAIKSGPSPRGDWKHAVVVWLTAQTMTSSQVYDVHDPHPSRDFLAAGPSEYAILRRLP